MFIILYYAFMMMYS